MVGEHLQDDGSQDRSQDLRSIRNQDHIVTDEREFLPLAFGSDRDDRASAGLDLLDVAEVLRKDGIVRRDHHGGSLCIHEGDDAMLQLSAGVSHGGNVADLLEFEGSLKGDRVVILPAHEEHDLGLGVALGDLGDLGLKLENRLDLTGERFEFRDDTASGGAGEIPDATQ